MPKLVPDYPLGGVDHGARYKQHALMTTVLRCDEPDAGADCSTILVVFVTTCSSTPSPACQHTANIAHAASQVRLDAIRHEVLV